MSDSITRGVRVQAEGFYIPGRSRPEQAYYFFAYQVRIANEGEDPVQLISRHWVITDADGRAQEVRGPGVVGEQPVLAPGQSFEYTSACPLPTPVGAMQGTYQMVVVGGDERFDAQVAPFTLAMPGVLN